jgi:hypothetical protein
VNRIRGNLNAAAFKAPDSETAARHVGRYRYLTEDVIRNIGINWDQVTLRDLGPPRKFVIAKIPPPSLKEAASPRISKPRRSIAADDR